MPRVESQWQSKCARTIQFDSFGNEHDAILVARKNSIMQNNQNNCQANENGKEIKSLNNGRAHTEYPIKLFD